MDFEAIKQAAKSYKADMSAFLQAMISHPSESCEEKEVVACIKAEMEKLSYDKIEIDGLGNVIGWIGTGDKIIAFDSHIDTVALEISTTGKPIPIRDMKQKTSSLVAAAPIKRAAWHPLFMSPKS